MGVAQIRVSGRPCRTQGAFLRDIFHFARQICPACRFVAQVWRVPARGVSRGVSRGPWAAGRRFYIKSSRVGPGPRPPCSVACVLGTRFRLRLKARASGAWRPTTFDIFRELGPIAGRSAFANNPWELWACVPSKSVACGDRERLSAFRTLFERAANS